MGGAPTMSEALATEAPQPSTTKPLYDQLPARGRRAVLDHDAVASNQRSRLIGAMIEEVTQRGYADATLARLVALAGVSKRAFHEQFGTKEAYFLATYDAIVRGTAQRVRVAYGSDGDWEAGLRAAFDAYASELIDEPNAARLVLVEALGAGSVAVARMQSTRLIFEQMLSASFSKAPDGVTLPPLIAKGIVCGVERITRQRLLAGEVVELAARADQLLAWALACRSPAAARLAAAPPAHCRALAPCCPRPGVENDRARILYSAARISAANGYARLTPRQIVCEAGVTEARFNELFQSTERCFLDALDRLGLEALVCAARAFQSSRDELVGVHRAIAALMRHIATNPVLVQVAFVETFGLGRAGVEPRERLLCQFTDQLMRAFPRASRLTAEASVGALWGIIHHHVARGATRLLPGFAGCATYLVLAPVIGGEGAVEVILACAEEP